MKYSILGFNQEKLLQYNLNLNEVLLLSYIYDAQASPTMLHIISDDGTQTYTWLNHEKIQSDLPILNTDERQLKRYIKHLNDCELIASKQFTVSGVRGSRAYYGITKECESLRYDADRQEQGSKMSPNKGGLGVKNVPSDNILNLDNKLNNIISKDIMISENPEITTTTSDNNPKDNLSEYESKMYRDERRKISKLEREGLAETNQPKKKRLSLWDKCIQIINEVTEDEKLRYALTEFLRMRIAMKDKPFFAPQFRTMVNKIFILNGDPLRIVNQTLEHGWASFYDEKSVTSYGGYNRTPNIATFGEHAGMNCNKVSDEEYKEIMRDGEKF